jgi:hypothetical protein
MRRNIPGANDTVAFHAAAHARNGILRQFKNFANALVLHRIHAHKPLWNAPPTG